MYKRLLFILLLIYIIGVFCSTVRADGRDIYLDRLVTKQIEVEFEMQQPSPDAPQLVGFELWCIFVEGSATMELVATLNDPNIRIWQLDPIQLPVGIKLPYYIKAVYEDGSKTPSTNAYNFALTKPPIMTNVK